MNSQDIMGLISAGLNATGGLMGGLDDSAERQNQQNLQQTREDELFMLMLQSLANQGDTEQGFRTEDLNRAVQFSNANPLGAEFNLRKDTVLGRAGLEALGGRQLARGTPNIASGFMDRPGVRDALSDSAIDQAIRDRRVSNAGIDPRAAMELGGTGDYAQTLFNNMQGSRQNQMNANTNVMNALKTRQQGFNDEAAKNQRQQQNAGGGGFWRQLGGAMLPVAGMAANFIPGVGPALGTLISGASGAAGGALTGGRRGALIGGALGTAGGYALNRAGLGNSNRPPQGAGFEGNTDFISRMALGNSSAGSDPSIIPGQVDGGLMTGLRQPVGQNRSETNPVRNTGFVNPITTPNYSSISNPNYNPNLGRTGSSGASGAWGPTNPAHVQNFINQNMLRPQVQNPTVRPGNDDVMMVGPNGASALARPEHVAALVRMGWRPQTGSRAQQNPFSMNKLGY